MYPALAGGFLTTAPPGKPVCRELLIGQRHPGAVRPETLGLLPQLTLLYLQLEVEAKGLGTSA